MNDIFTEIKDFHAEILKVNGIRPSVSVKIDDTSFSIVVEWWDAEKGIQRINSRFCLYDQETIVTSDAFLQGVIRYINKKIGKINRDREIEIVKELKESIKVKELVTLVQTTKEINNGV